MSEPRDPIIRLEERRPAHLVDVILRQSREHLLEQRSLDKQTAAAREYVRARLFLERFRLSFAMFLIALLCGALQIMLVYPLGTKTEWVSIAANAANLSFGGFLLIIGFRRKAEAERIIDQANRAAEARKAAVSFRE